MHAQDFDAPWPGVLDEMAEFVLLTQLAFGAARAPWVRIRLSRTRVTPGELQPHVDRLRARLARRLPPSSRIRVQADALAAHRVEVAYGSAGP